MRTGFVVPLVCFAFIALYGATWQKLEAADYRACANFGPLYG